MEFDSPEMVQINFDEPEDEKKSSGGGFLSIILMAVGAGAAAFGTVYFLPQPDIPMPVCEEEPVEIVEEQIIETPPLSEIIFVELDTLLISLGRDPSANHLKIGVTLETTSDYQGTVMYAQPKLKDAFTGYLRALEVKKLEDPAFMTRLRAQLLRRAEVVLGSEAVHGVLITEFYVT